MLPLDVETQLTKVICYNDIFFVFTNYQIHRLSRFHGIGTRKEFSFSQVKLTAVA